MTPLPVISNVSRVAFTWHPTLAVNVMHFKQESIDMEGLFGAIMAALDHNMWACQYVNSYITEVKITPLDGGGLTQSFVPPLAPPWNGMQTGDVAPAVCGVLSEVTSLRGRKYRGRAYLGPATEGAGTNGMMTGSIATAIANGFTNFGSALASDGVQHVVASYLGRFATPIVQYLVRNAFGTMRPRQSRLA